MSRIIRINSCQECPSRSHNGGFGNPAYVPVCRKTDPARDLPFTTRISGKIIVAEQTPGIPDWCPLERE